MAHPFAGGVAAGGVRHHCGLRRLRRDRRLVPSVSVVPPPLSASSPWRAGRPRPDHPDEPHRSAAVLGRRHRLGAGDVAGSPRSRRRRRQDLATQSRPRRRQGSAPPRVRRRYDQPPGARPEGGRRQDQQDQRHSARIRRSTIRGLCSIQLASRRCCLPGSRTEPPTQCRPNTPPGNAGANSSGHAPVHG
jgi:hypothetical protein